MPDPRRFFAVALAIFTTGSPAAGQSIEPYREWIERAHSIGSLFCCTMKDFRVVADGDWRMGKGGYEVRIDGHWVVVDPDRVVSGNPTGHPAVWYAIIQDKPYVYCFAQGMEG